MKYGVVCYITVHLFLILLFGISRESGERPSFSRRKFETYL
jgi:hypothetical protein